LATEQTFAISTKHKLIPIHSRGINLFVPDVPGIKVQNFDYEDAIEVSVPEEYESHLDLKPTLPDAIEPWRMELRLEDSCPQTQRNTRLS